MKTVVLLLSLAALFLGSQCVELDPEEEDDLSLAYEEDLEEEDEGERYERGLKAFGHNSAFNLFGRRHGHQDNSRSKSNSQKGDEGDNSNSRSKSNSGGGGKGGSRNRGNNKGAFQHKQKGVSTGPEQPVAVEKGPCHNKKCKGLFQIPIPPSCECRCPGPADKASCSPEKEFDDNICECVCHDINFNCVGNADFDFDVCNCVCRLHQRDCGQQQTMDPTQCICVDIPPPSPPPPACTLQCRGANQYLDQEKCQCKCQRFLIKKTYRHGSSIVPEDSDFEGHETDFEGQEIEQGIDFEGQLEDELQHKRSLHRWGSRTSGKRSHSRPRFGSRIGKPRISKTSTRILSKPRTFSTNVGRVKPKPFPIYSQTCPAGKRVDHNTCVCYW